MVIVVQHLFFASFFPPPLYFIYFLFLSFFSSLFSCFLFTMLLLIYSLSWYTFLYSNNNNPKVNWDFNRRLFRHFSLINSKTWTIEKLFHKLLSRALQRFTNSRTIKKLEITESYFKLSFSRVCNPCTRTRTCLWNITCVRLDFSPSFPLLFNLFYSLFFSSHSHFIFFVFFSSLNLSFLLSYPFLLFPKHWLYIFPPPSSFHDWETTFSISRERAG